MDQGHGAFSDGHVQRGALVMIPGLQVKTRFEEPRQHCLMVEQVEKVQQRALPPVPDMRIHPRVKQPDDFRGVAVLNMAEEFAPLLAQRFRRPAAVRSPGRSCGAGRRTF